MSDTSLSSQRFNIFDKIPKTGIFGTLLWIGIVTGSLAWNLHVYHSSRMHEARHDAEATYDMEAAYLSHLHGLASIAFYDLRDDKDQILTKIPYRSVTTTNSRTLDLAMIPHFAEHVHTELEKNSGIKIRRTSLHPLGDTFPDAWESAALRAFHKGTPEVCSVETLSGNPYMRLMRPFRVEQMCFRCHGENTADNVMGGLSVSVPLEGLITASAGVMRGIWASHVLSGIVGTCLILFFTARDQRKTLSLQKSERCYVEFTEHLPIGVFRYDLSADRFVMANATMAHMLGFDSVDGFLEIGAKDFFADASEHERVMKELKRGDDIVSEKVRLRRNDGKPMCAAMKTRVTRDMANEIVYFDGLVQDITQCCQLTTERDQLRDELVETSRQAGMAEIATSVLHNVGNVLNSVNVSSHLLMEKLHRFGVADLCKAADLIEAHQDDLGEFVTHDEHGQHLGQFLIAQSRQMAAEEDNMIQEMHSLLRNIEHIKEIVALQQEHAGLSGFAQKVSLQNILEDAIEINFASIQRHQIQLTREFQELPPAMVDKQKILQIVINLISNAKQALDHMDPKERHLTLRLYQVGTESVRIEVEDNGIGIPAEDLTRIFAHGFTTKKDGHGFGLHGAALQAKEMGGSLTASSDGPGMGATFTLELPFKSATVLEFAI